MNSEYCGQAQDATAKFAQLPEFASAGGWRSLVCVGRTLLSAAVAVAVAVELTLPPKTKVKGGGQECPPHMTCMPYSAASSSVSPSVRINSSARSASSEIG